MTALISTASASASARSGGWKRRAGALASAIAGPVQEHVKAVSACLEASCEYTRFGSGALGMAFAADGRLDGCYEVQINPWDVAAGLALVTEAGGWCSNYFGAPDAITKGNAILATAAGLVQSLRKLLSV